VGRLLPALRHPRLGVEPARKPGAGREPGGPADLGALLQRRGGARHIRTDGAPQLVTAAGVFFHLDRVCRARTAGVAALIGDSGVFCVQAIYLGRFCAIPSSTTSTMSISLLDLEIDPATLRRPWARGISRRSAANSWRSLELLVARKGTARHRRVSIHMAAEEERLGFGNIETYRTSPNASGRSATSCCAFSASSRPRESGARFGAPAKVRQRSIHSASRRNSCRSPSSGTRSKSAATFPAHEIPIVHEDAAQLPDAYLILP